MGIIVDKIKALLGMDKDKDYPYVDPRSYLDAKNVRHISQGGSTGISIQNVLGNTSAFGIDMSVQAKEYRIYIDATTAKSYNFSFTDANDFAMGNTGPITIPINDIPTAISNILTGIAGFIAGIPSFNLGTITATQDNGDDTGYIDLKIFLNDLPSGGYEWFMTSIGTDEATLAIIAEALDVSLIGTLMPIGSNDLLGDLTIYWSPCVNLPGEVAISNAADNGAGLIRITTTVAHGLLTGMSVTIADVLGTTEANGTWLINVIDDFNFDLYTSSFANAYVSGGIVNTYVDGFGIISVAQQNNNTGSWTIYQLLRSKELNFRIPKMIDCFDERNIFLESRYFTDDYNVPRVFYYSGTYLNDGAITALNPDGKYAYGSIADEIRLLLSSTNVKLTWQKQYQTGGAVLSGNHRYAIRLLTESLSATPWTDLSNPINVCRADTTLGANNLNASFISTLSGDDAFTPTGKINEFLITGITPGLFKYVELADINYVDNAFQGMIVRRDLLQNTETQIIQHTGNETDVQDLDVATLNFLPADIYTARNINQIDSRLVLSNITAAFQTDFTAVCQSWTHTVKRKEIPAAQYPASGAYYNYEYIIPENLYSSMGYMFNEIYRYSAKFRLKNGAITENFWIDDVRIDCEATNSIANPTSDRRVNQLAYPLNTYDLTDAGGNTVYVPDVEFNGMDLNAIVNGFRLRDIVSEIIIERVEIAENLREVLACGLIALGAQIELYFGNPTQSPPYDTPFHEFGMIYNGGSPGVPGVGDYPFISGQFLYDGNATLIPNNQSYNFTAYHNSSFGGTFSYTRMRKFMSFYSWDLIFGEADYTPNLTTDKLVNFGSPETLVIAGNTAKRVGVQGVNGGCQIYSSLREFTGYLGGVAIYQNGTAGEDLEDAINLAQGATGSLNGQTYSKYLPITDFDTGPFVFPDPEYAFPTSPVLATTNDITDNGTGNDDFAGYYGQIYRARGSGINKYGAITSSKYIPTGCSLEIDSSTVTPASIIVLGGDVFTQKSWLRHRIPQTSLAANIGDPSKYWIAGFGGGMGFYSQNRVNTQMRNTQSVAPSFTPQNYRYPAIGETTWLEQVLTLQTSPQYNFGYNVVNEISSNTTFDPSLPRSTDMPTRIYWSDSKPQDSAVDNFRNILPLNFKDLPLSDGEIVHHADVNGELCTWQMRRFMQQYFNARGELQISDISGVVIGDGAVMKRDGKTVSIIGATHKWAIIRGKSQGGNDVMYWINAELKKVIRFGGDGTRSVADIQGMQSWFANNLRWILNQDVPTMGTGIYGVWDDRNLEALWTIMGQRDDIDPWEESTVEYTDLVDFPDGGGARPVDGMLRVGSLFYGTTSDVGGGSTLFQFDPATGNKTILHSFIPGTDGTQPQFQPIMGPDGKLYGTTQAGGANSLGTLWNWDIGGSTFTNVYDFTAAEGAPASGLASQGVNIWGTTQGGGFFGRGVIYYWDVIGLAFNYIWDLDTAGGYGCFSRLINDGTGILYGAAYLGGASSAGAIFSWDTNTSAFTTLHSFAGGAGGAAPVGLYLALNGLIYGCTQAGGANGAGLLYSFNPAGAVFTALQSMSTATRGSQPTNELREDAGWIYGTCRNGGLNSQGTIWVYNIASDLFLKLFDMANLTGGQPWGNLLLYNGIWYGTCSVQGAGNSGVIFSVEIDLIGYSLGELVTRGTTTYEGTPQIYRSLINNNYNIDPAVPTVPPSWEVIARTDGSFYNEYTICFNEEKNRFTTFYTFKPRIYLKWRDTFLSPDPASNANVYLHNTGRYCMWYNGNNENGYIVLIYAKDENTTKQMQSLWIASEEVPFRIEAFTKDHETFMVAANFESFFNQHTVPFYMDILSSSTGAANNEDTTRLIGQYVLVKVEMEYDVFQKLVDVVIKFINLSRMYIK